MTTKQIIKSMSDAIAQKLIAYVTGGGYNSTNHTIELKNGNRVIATIDASAFIVDGMVDDVRIENENLVIHFNTASGKQDISIPLTDIFNPDLYYTKVEINTLMDASGSVIGAFLANLSDDIENLRKGLSQQGTLYVKELSSDYLPIVCKAPSIVQGKGAPSPDVVPDNWNMDKYHNWKGVPRFIGQRYHDVTNKKIYECMSLTNSISDWILLN